MSSFNQELDAELIKAGIQDNKPYPINAEAARNLIITVVNRVVKARLPEKRIATMVMSCPYCHRNFPTNEEEYNTALNEVDKALLGESE